jgi:hypothetical protein
MYLATNTRLPALTAWENELRGSLYIKKADNHRYLNPPKTAVIGVRI